MIYAGMPPTRSYPQQWFVYRCFDADGVLLYIGRSRNPMDRVKAHQHKTWWADVDRIDLEEFESKGLMLAAEFNAIRRERPLHNVQGKKHSPSEDPALNTLAADELAARLWVMRCTAGLGRLELSDRIRLMPTYAPETIELRTRLPKKVEVIAWADLCGAADDVRHELLLLLWQAQSARQASLPDAPA